MISPRSKSTLLPDRLTRVDEIYRGDHFYLEDGDRCYFFGEYFGGLGFEGGPTNDLIYNFKIKPSAIRKKPQRERYKSAAICTVANGLRNALSRQEAESLTWVAIPPSKAVGHPDYDDRLSRALATAFGDYDADIRLLLRQRESTEADHHAQGSRLTPDELFDVLEVDATELARGPIREKGIVLFDDVLTTGKHFKCCERRLRQVPQMRDARILGVFVARRVLPNPFAGFGAA